MKMRSIILGAALGLGFSTLAQGSVIYNYIIQPTGSGITLGATDTLNLYLQEVSTSGSFKAANDGGLYDGGVALIESAGGTGVTFNSVTANNASEPTGFSGNDTKGLATNGGVWIADITGNSASQGVSAVSTSTVGGTTTSLYLLGSTSATFASNASATLKVESLHDAPSSDGIALAGSNFNTLTYTTNYDLDLSTSVNGDPAAPGATGANGHPATVTIGGSPVPEPASMAIFGIGAAGLLIKRRRTA